MPNRLIIGCEDALPDREHCPTCLQYWSRTRVVPWKDGLKDPLFGIDVDCCCHCAHYLHDNRAAFEQIAKEHNFEPYPMLKKGGASNVKRPVTRRKLCEVCGVQEAGPGGICKSCA